MHQVADTRDVARTSIHIFDPLGSTLHPSNRRAYCATFMRAFFVLMCPFNYILSRLLMSQTIEAGSVSLLLIQQTHWAGCQLSMDFQSF